MVDMDLEKFFDNVNQSKLIEVLSRTISDGRVVSLIHKYLRAGVMADGRYEDTPTGVPQGGNISPLLSNVMLNELDKELEIENKCFNRFFTSGWHCPGFFAGVSLGSNPGSDVRLRCSPHPGYV